MLCRCSSTAHRTQDGTRSGSMQSQAIHPLLNTAMAPSRAIQIQIGSESPQTLLCAASPAPQPAQAPRTPSPVPAAGVGPCTSPRLPRSRTGSHRTNSPVILPGTPPASHTALPPDHTAPASPSVSVGSPASHHASPPGTPRTIPHSAPHTAAGMPSPQSPKAPPEHASPPQTASTHSGTAIPPGTPPARPSSDSRTAVSLPASHPSLPSLPACSVAPPSPASLALHRPTPSNRSPPAARSPRMPPPPDLAPQQADPPSPRPAAPRSTCLPIHPPPLPAECASSAQTRSKQSPEACPDPAGTLSPLPQAIAASAAASSRSPQTHSKAALPTVQSAVSSPLSSSRPRTMPPTAQTALLLPEPPAPLPVHRVLHSLQHSSPALLRQARSLSTRTAQRTRDPAPVSTPAGSSLPPPSACTLARSPPPSAHQLSHPTAHPLHARSLGSRLHKPRTLAAHPQAPPHRTSPPQAAPPPPNPPAAHSGSTTAAPASVLHARSSPLPPAARCTRAHR